MSLPPTSFAKFGVAICNEPLIVWTAPHIDEKTAADRAYCVPMQYESRGAYGGKAYALADFYGGVGPGGAGGSGRCGVLGWGPFSIQVKGIGVTPLVDPRADEFHRSGTMTLEEASHEVLFGEIYDAVLPHGAVRCDALFLTGGRYTEEGPYDVKLPRWRACIQRSFVWRPAHFMRNTRFQQIGFAPVVYDYSPDVRRTRAAIQELPSILRGIYAPDSKAEAGTAETLNYCLYQLADRFAHQIAATVGLRINHGALSCGNISLDGRLLDFGLTSYVPAFRRHARPPNWQDPFNQNDAIKATLRGIRLHLSKYSTATGKENLTSDSAIIEYFDKSYHRHLEDELSKLCGLSGSALLGCPRNLKSDLSKAVIAIGTRGVKEPYVHFKAHSGSGGANQPPRYVGRYDVCAILKEAGLGLTQNLQSNRLHQLLDDDILLSNLQRSLNAVRAWLWHYSSGVSLSDLDLYLGQEMFRRNSSLSFLQRRATQKVFSEIEQSDSPERAGLMVREMAARAIQQLTTSEWTPSANGISLPAFAS